MPNYKEAAQAAIENADGDIGAAASAIYNGSKPLALYVISVGLEHLKARRRATRRRELRAVVQPQFVPGKTVGSIVLTPQAKKRIEANTRDLFGKDGWNIGDINIGSLTKEDLLAQALKERGSAKGHLRNAKFYEALAEPMEPGQIVKDYWKQPSKVTAIKNDVWKTTEDRQPTL